MTELWAVSLTQNEKVKRWVLKKLGSFGPLVAAEDHAAEEVPSSPSDKP